MKRCYGAFEHCKRCVTLVGFSYRTEKQLLRKIKRAKRKGFVYDGVLCPLKECEQLPAYVRTRF